MLRGQLWVLALALGLPLPLSSQEPVPPEVEPGRVETIVLSVPHARTAALLAYRLRVAAGVRLFQDSIGRIEPAGDTLSFLPLTFQLPASAPAGLQEVAWLSLSESAGAPLVRTVRVVVQERRRLRIVLDSTSLAWAAGGAQDAPFSVRNDGNVPLVARLAVSGDAEWVRSIEPEELRVAPGEAATGMVRLVLPPDAAGQSRVLRLRASAEGASGEVGAVLRALASEERAERWLWMPLEVGVGAMGPLGHPGEAGYRFSLQGRTEVSEDVFLDVRYRDKTGVEQSLLLDGLYYGSPRLVQLSTPRTSLAVGDLAIPVRMGALSGTYGAGARLRWDGERYGGAALWMRPAAERFGDRLWALRGTRKQLLGGELDLVLGGGEMAPGADAEDVSRSQLAQATYRTAVGTPHDVQLSAGAVRQETGGAAGFEPLYDVRYSHQSEALRIGAQARLLPEHLPGTQYGGTERMLNASRRVAGPLFATGTLYSHCVRGGHLSEAVCAEGGTLGGMYRSRHAQWTAALGRRRATRDSLDAEWRDVASLAAQLPVRRGLSARVQGEATRDPSGAEPTHLSWGGALDWSYGTHHAWAELRRFDAGGVPVIAPRLDAGLTLSHGPWKWEGALGHSLSGSPEARSTAAWSRLHAPAGRRQSVVLGLDYRRMGTDAPGAWSMSLSLSRQLSVPLPLRNPAYVHGIVFDDANGNGRRDPGEAGIEGVRLRRGEAWTASASGGVYSLSGGRPDARVELDAATLPERYVPHPGAASASTGARQDVALVRLASLEIRVRQGTHGPASGATLELRSEDGRSYSAVADESGTLRLGALVPGRYQAVLQAAQTDFRATPRLLTLEITLAPGAAERMELELPVAEREIRFSS
jgi:hypothetical protein